MTPLSRVVLVLLIVTIISMATLFLLKLTRHYRERKAAFRNAVYISTLGEIVSRSMEPSSDIDGWADDPAFHDTLIDFFTLVAGEEQRILIELADRLHMIDRFHADLTNSRRISTRLRAVAALAVIASPKSRPHLVAALRDPSPEVRIEAAAGLSIIKHEDDVEPVVVALEREERWVAERFADALVRFGPSAVPTLSNYVLISGPLLDPAPRHLSSVVRCLGQIGDQRAETALLTALDGVDAQLRIRAAAALGHPWGDRVLNALLGKIADPDWRVRAQVASALAHHNSPASIPYLAEALTDPAWWVRQNAAATLATIDGGLEALFDALNYTDRFAGDAARAQLMARGARDGDEPDLAARFGLLYENFGQSDEAG
ncbi:MAG: HEAT repeat domain-containing protein [Acidimicrobiia bacterium]|nr:HEAT repeat domain-containing protein [Acidimicrobiia bacterium]MDH5504576.1 HEAT repeat domain-containing protein [Acidimicrobiia bacterium]